MERVDAVVVGAGVMGSAAAAALGGRRVETVLLEQFRVGHARGSSHGPTRIFRLSYPHPDYTRLAQRAMDLWRSLEEAAGERLLVPTGGLDVGPAAEDCGRSLEEAGIRHEWLSAAEASERFPAIGFTDRDPVLYQPDAGVCLADRAVAAQARVARRRGVDVREEAEVTALHPTDGGVRVTTPGGEIEAPVVVVTAGPWAPRLLAGAGLPGWPLTPTVQCVSYFAGPAGTSPPDLPTFIDWDSGRTAWYAVPAVGDAPGVKVGRHVPGPPVDPGAGPFRPDPDAVARAAAYVRTRLPGLDPSPARSETCLYTVTPDEDFVLDRVGPVVVGSACSGHGFKFAPAIGEILADLATGRDPGLPGRFGATRPALRGATPRRTRPGG